jgi:hypothetical protein
MMDKYVEAKKILTADYKNIMSAYSLLCTQIEVQEDKMTTEQISAKAAYYTVVWRYLKNEAPMISVVEKNIKKNLDKKLTDVDNELAVAILVESRIHDLELAGLVFVKRNTDGTTVVSLTEKGKQMSRNIQRDIRDQE